MQVRSHASVGVTLRNERRPLFTIAIPNAACNAEQRKVTLARISDVYPDFQERVRAIETKLPQETGLESWDSARGLQEDTRNTSIRIVMTDLSQKIKDSEEKGHFLTSLPGSVCDSSNIQELQKREFLAEFPVEQVLRPESFWIANQAIAEGVFFIPLRIEHINESFLKWLESENFTRWELGNKIQHKLPTIQKIYHWKRFFRWNEIEGFYEDSKKAQAGLLKFTKTWGAFQRNPQSLTLEDLDYLDNTTHEITTFFEGIKMAARQSKKISSQIPREEVTALAAQARRAYDLLLQIPSAISKWPHVNPNRTKSEKNSIATVILNRRRTLRALVEKLEGGSKSAQLMAHTRNILASAESIIAIYREDNPGHLPN